MNTTRRLLISAITISILSPLSGCATTETISRSLPGTTTTIILTRHGDRNIGSKELNDKGRARAKALVRAVEGIKITAIYSPDKKRNLDTARPLAKHLGIKINVVPAVMHHVTTTMLTEHPGESVLWVGNINNLKAIYSLLEGEGRAPISYGDLYIMKIKDSGKPEITKKHYGPL